MDGAAGDLCLVMWGSIGAKLLIILIGIGPEAGRESRP